MAGKQQRRFFLLLLWSPLCDAVVFCILHKSYAFYGSSIREKAHSTYLPISTPVNEKKDIASMVPSVIIISGL